MKKPIILILALAVLAALGFYAMNLKENAGTTVKTELIDFAIKDVSTVDKIVIKDSYGNTFELKKGASEWTDKKGGCVPQESVEFIIDAFKNIEFKGYLPDNSHERMTKMMTAQHTSVEIYQNGEWTKTWYIGPPAKDHYGQVMLLDSKEYGKSDIPVLMKIKGMNGIIEPRFYADARKWMCTEIIALGMNEIASVDVKFYDEPQRSFKVTKQGNAMNVYQNGNPIPADTAMIFRYLNNYQKVHFELANYQLSRAQVDSLKKSRPFAVMTIKETNQHSTRLRCFRIGDAPSENAGMMTVENMDKNRLWVELPNGEVVKCQYFVFNPLLLGHVYFPLNLEGVQTHDGITPIDEVYEQEK